MPGELVSVILSFVDVQDQVRHIRLVSRDFCKRSGEADPFSWPPVMLWHCLYPGPPNQLSPGRVITNQKNFAVQISSIVRNNQLRRVTLTGVCYPTLQHFSFSDTLEELTIVMRDTPKNTPRDSRFTVPLDTAIPDLWAAILPVLPFGATTPGLISLTVYRGGGLPTWVWTSMLTQRPLSALKSLRTLVLSTIPVGDEPVRYLRGLPLELLDLSATSVTNEAMPTVGAIMSLITLRLQRLPRVNDAGLQHLVRLTCLRSLDLSYTSVSNTGMSYLASLTSLTSLALIGNNRISDLGLEHLHELPLIIVDLALTSVCTRGVLQLLNHCLQLDLIGMTALRGTRKEMFHHLTADSDVAVVAV
jgi:hypothetical protein